MFLYGIQSDHSLRERCDNQIQTFFFNFINIIKEVLEKKMPKQARNKSKIKKNKEKDKNSVLKECLKLLLEVFQI